MPEIEPFTVIRGTTPRMTFRLKALPSSPTTDWTTSFIIKKHVSDVTPILTIAGALSSDVPNAANLGVFDVALSAAQTLALEARDYAYSFRRTNVGFEDVLTFGTLTVKSA
jgi:hypothetical protein